MSINSEAEYYLALVKGQISKCSACGNVFETKALVGKVCKNCYQLGSRGI